MRLHDLPFFKSFRPFPTACAVEPVSGPWTNSPNWGNSFSGPIPASDNQVVSVVETADIPGPPRVLVVNLFRSDPAFPGSSNSQVRARITYGIGAKQNSFDCDWTQGAQLALVANYVRVNFVSYAPSSDAAYAQGSNKSIVLGAGLAVGNAAKTHALSYTYPMRILNNAPNPPTFYDVLVPDFAQALVLHARKVGTNATAPAAGDLTVQFRATASQVIAAWDGLRVQDFSGEGLRLPGGTVFVRIQNSVAAAPPDVQFFVTPQFILGL